MVNSRKTVKSVVSNHSEGDIMTGSLQVKNDKFYMIINLKENGKRKQKWVSTGLEVKGNKRKAEQMLREFLTSQEQVQSKPKSSVLFSDYIRHWLTIAERRVDSVTFQGYRLMANAQVIPYFEKTAVPSAARRSPRTTSPAPLAILGRNSTHILRSSVMLSTTTIFTR